MPIPEKTWKEKKQEQTARINQRLRSVRVLKPEFRKPGARFTDYNGDIHYYIASDGSRRRVK